MKAFYFGCARGIRGRTEAGHYLYCRDARGGLAGAPSLLLRNGFIPWGTEVDGGLAPRVDPGRYAEEAPQGVAALHHQDGWTALSFWDRTGDSRGGSSSTFLFDAELDFDAAVAAARERFPQLVARFDFEIRPVAA